MERVFNALRAFILNDLNAALPRWEDGETKMPPLGEQAVRFGAIDPLKTAGDTLCAILPESLELEDGYITGEGRAKAGVTCAFWCRGAGYDEVMRRMARYADCFCACLAANPSLSGGVFDCAAKRVEFDWDCGAAERQAAACMIELDVFIEEENNEHGID